MTVNLYSGSLSKDKMAPLRAILALLIVADHLTFWIPSPIIQPFRELGAPIVSIFLFISGYGLMKSYLLKGDDYLQSFGRRRLLKVIVPAIIALILYWLLCFDQRRDYLDCITVLLTNGVPLFPYSWYVVAIIVLYCAYWVSFKLLPMKYKCIGVVMLSIAYIFATIKLGYDWCWWIGTLAFPTGLYYAKYEEQLSRIIFKNWLTYFGALVACSIIVIALVFTHSEYAYLFSYIFIPVIVALLVSVLPLDRINNPIVLFLGSVSYEIYLCQGIGMEFLRPHISSDVLFAVAVYVVVVLLAFFVNRTSKLILR